MSQYSLGGKIEFKQSFCFISLELIDEALVDVDPVAPDRPPLDPIVLLTSTGVSYFNSENPCYAAVEDVY